jgi:hypothetical protein
MEVTIMKNQIQNQLPLCARSCRGKRMQNWMLVATLMVIGCGGGLDGEGSDGTRAARCARMRDRVVELSLADATGVDGAAHQAALRRALGPELVRACERAMTDRQVDCVLSAAGPAETHACVERVNR